MLIEYIIIMFSIYLLASLFITYVSDYTYKEILTSQHQLYAAILFYWWPPIFRMVDMDEHNKSIRNF